MCRPGGQQLELTMGRKGERAASEVFRRRGLVYNRNDLLGQLPLLISAAV